MWEPRYCHQNFVRQQNGFVTAQIPRYLWVPLPQFSTCSGWRWLEVGEKLPRIGKPVSRPRVLGLVPEQIHNKLKISGNVQQTIPYNILKVPKNPPWAFWEIQDGVQDGRQFHNLSYLGPIIIKMSLLSLNIGVFDARNSIRTIFNTKIIFLMIFLTYTIWKPLTVCMRKSYMRGP